MKRLVLAIGLVLSTNFVSNAQQNDTNTSYADSLELLGQITQIIQENGLFEIQEYKDHTHLRNNLMRIILSKDNFELFKAIDEEKKYFGNITYWKNINGVCVDVTSIVPYDEPNVTVYNTTILNEIINEIKLNYPKNKMFNPDEIDVLEYVENHDNLVWKFEKNGIEYELNILFNHTQIHSIDFSRNIIK